MKIHWITFAPIENNSGQLSSQLASARYRVLIPAKELANRGFQIQVFNTQTIVRDVPEDILKCDQIVFSKSFTPVNEFIAREAKARGIRIIVDLCDNHFVSEPELRSHLIKMCELADVIVCSTPAMAEALMEHTGRAGTIISDPYEGEHQNPVFTPKKSCELCWFGHTINVPSLLNQLVSLEELATEGKLGKNPILRIVTGVIPELEEAIGRYNKSLTKWKLELIPWSLKATWDAFFNSDIVLVTTEGSAGFRAVKSPNRVIEPLWAGKMVVANPLPAYLEFSDSAILCEDLKAGIQKVLDLSPDEIHRRITLGQDLIARKYSPQVIGALWHQVLKPDSKGNIAQTEGSQIRLNLGCGDKILPGYINVDVASSRAGKEPDVICDLRDLKTFESNFADEILSVHVVEHFWRWEVLDILKEWVRVLKPGGKMIIECPNLLSACEEVLKNPDIATGPGPEGQRSMWVLYGDPSWRDPLMIHRWAYTPRSLAQLLFEAGLQDLMQEPAQFKLREPRDMRITGIKPVEKK